jgi:hypothetical protein
MSSIPHWRNTPQYTLSYIKLPVTATSPLSFVLTRTDTSVSVWPGVGTTFTNSSMMNGSPEVQKANQLLKSETGDLTHNITNLQHRATRFSTMIHTDKSLTHDLRVLDQLTIYY